MLLGLRFERRAAPRLRQLAAQVRNGEAGAGSSANVFEQAARAALLGEPLEVYCENPIEVVHMAALYGRLGVPLPVIEELNGA